MNHKVNNKTLIEDLYIGFFDGPHATPQFMDEGPIFLGIKNITEDGRLDLTEINHISEQDFRKWTRRVTPQSNDIVFTYEAALHRYAIIPKDFKGCLGRRLALIRPNLERVNPKFLLYYFLGNYWKALISSKIFSGSTVDRIPLIDFPRFEVSIPPLPVQKKIAAVLSAYDDLIENNTRRIALLEKMVEEIYREWFVRLRFPGHEQTTFHKGIPEGWSVEKIGSFSQEIRTGVKVKDLDSSTKYLGLEHLPRKSILVREFSTIDSVQSDKLLFNNGYILFGKIRPYLHKVALAYFSGACSSDTIVIRPKYRYCEGFLLFTIFSNTFIELATISSKGTKMPRADWNFLEKLEIVLPSQKILEEYQEKFEIYFSLMSNLSRINEKLQQTRDRLLTRLISGKLSLEDLDIQFPPSTTDPPSPAQGQA